MTWLSCLGEPLVFNIIFVHFSDKQPDKGEKKKMKKNASSTSLSGNNAEQSRGMHNQYDGL